MIPSIVVVPSPEPDELQPAVAGTGQPAAEGVSDAEPAPVVATEEAPKAVRAKRTDHEVASWLSRLLMSARGTEMMIQDIYAAGAERGYSERSLRHAAGKLEVTKIEFNGRPVAWRLEVDPRDAAPVPPKVVRKSGPPTVGELQRLFDEFYRKYRGKDAEGNLTGLSMVPYGPGQYNANLVVLERIAGEMRRAGRDRGFQFSDGENETGDKQMQLQAAAIMNGTRPIAGIDTFPGLAPNGPNGVDMRATEVRRAERELAQAQEKVEAAKVALDRERAGAAT